MHPLRYLLAALCLLATPALAQLALTGAGLGSPAVAGSCVIVSVSPSGAASFAGLAASGTVVSAMSASTTGSCASPTWTISGTDQASFQVATANLETQGVLLSRTYSINIIATIAGASGSPYTQPETITGTGMDTPVVMGGHTQPSTSAISYLAPSGQSWSTAESVSEVPMPVSGTIRNLTVNEPATLTGAMEYINSLLNVTASTSIGGITNCPITVAGTYCNDTADSPLTVTAGDLVVLKTDPNSSSPGAVAGGSASFVLHTPDGTSGIFFSGATAPNGAQNWVGFTSGPNTTEALVSSIIPGPTAGATVGAIDRIYAIAGNAPASSKGYAVLLYVNGAITPIGGGATCTSAVAGGVQATILTACTCVIYSASKSCNDVLTSSVTVHASDTVSLSFYPYGTPTAQAITASARYTPSAAYNAIMLGSWTTLPTLIAARYALIEGAMSNSTTQSAGEGVVPIGMHIKDLWSAIDTAAPSGDTRTQLFQASAATGTPPTCGITSTASSGITIGGLGNAFACYDLTDTAIIANSSVAAGPTSADITTSQNAGTTSIAAFYKTSIVVTVP